MDYVALVWVASAYIVYRPEDNVVCKMFLIPLSFWMLRLWDWLTWGWVGKLETQNQHVQIVLPWAMISEGPNFLWAQKTLSFGYNLDSLCFIKIIFLFQFDYLTLSIYLLIPAGTLEEEPSLTIVTLNYKSVINEIQSIMLNENKRWVFR